MVKALVPASALLLTAALAAGMYRDRLWLTALALLLATGQGILAGLAWPSFWRGPFQSAIFGAGGRFLGFLAAVAFGVVEAYAVGAGWAKGGPVLAALLLAPPVLVAAIALRGAVRYGEGEDGQSGDRPASDRRAG